MVWIHTVHAAAAAAAPNPILCWDAMGLAAVMPRGGSVQSWASSGASNVALQAQGAAGAQPVLAYEAKIPHVDVGAAKGMPLRQDSAGALPGFPIEAMPPGASPGVTIFLVARMPTTSKTGGSIFACSGGLYAVERIAIRRRANRPQLEFMWRLEPQVGIPHGVYTAQPVVTGSFEVYALRIGTFKQSVFWRGDVVSTQMVEGAVEGSLNAFTFPVDLGSCMMGGTYVSNTSTIQAAIRELEVFDYALSEVELSREMQRLHHKWNITWTSMRPLPENGELSAGMREVQYPSNELILEHPVLDCHMAHGHLSAVHLKCRTHATRCHVCMSLQRTSTLDALPPTII